MGAMLKWAGQAIAAVISWIFSLFADLDISAATNAISGITKYIRAACYFLPMGAVKGIFACVIGLMSMRLIIRAVKTLWDLIPVL